MLRFGTDGIRGVANRELTPELVTALGRAAARVLGDGQPFVVGRDTRRSGPMLAAALVAGLCAEGADVLDAGVLPTPGVAHLAAAHDFPAAMVSASHNPYTDNGVKLFAAGGRKLDDLAEARVERELEALAVAGLAGGAADAGPGGRVAPWPDPEGDYVEHLAAALGSPSFRGRRVVVDAGNGAAYRVAPRVLERLGATVDVRNVEPDGENINAGCGSTDPGELQAFVVERGADLGLAFDGDADRVIAVDEQGRLVDGDRMLAIIAIDLHGRGRLAGDAVVATVMSNLGLRRALAAHGLDMVETPVGDRNVLLALEERGLVLGGEQSGHLILREVATTGDGTLTGLALLDVMARTRRPLSELAAVVQPLPQVLRNVTVDDREALAAADGFWAAVRAAEVELGADGRVLVRPSGTEPLVRVMVEASSRDRAEAVAAELAAAAVAACVRR
jgi:phosphoglucosamine mutase